METVPILNKNPYLVDLVEQIKKALDKFNLPYLNVNTSNNLCDSVHIKLSLEPKEKWNNGFWENSPSMMLHIFCETRYYETGRKLSVELSQKSYKVVSKHRKYTSSDFNKIVENVVKQVGDFRNAYYPF